MTIIIIVKLITPLYIYGATDAILLPPDLSRIRQGTQISFVHLAQTIQHSSSIHYQWSLHTQVKHRVTLLTEEGHTGWAGMDITVNRSRYARSVCHDLKPIFPNPVLSHAASECTLFICCLTTWWVCTWKLNLLLCVHSGGFSYLEVKQLQDKLNNKKSCVEVNNLKYYLLTEINVQLSYNDLSIGNPKSTNIN